VKNDTNSRKMEGSLYHILNFFKYIYLLMLMIIRNIRWLAILCFSGKSRPFDILDFQMYLSAHNAGLDLRENSIHKQLILDGVREKKSTEIMKRFIRPDDIILELGANIGYYVLIESTVLSDTGYIYAVEPAPENVTLLKKNIALNNIRNVEVFHMAMSDKEGIAKLYMGKACNLHSLVGSPNAIDAEFVEVETNTVDNFLKGRKSITFLRMDIEGYEATVIDGMQETLESPGLKKMFIEIHPHRVSADKMQYLLKKVQESGFEIKYAVSHDSWQRGILGHCKVEEMNLSQLAQDQRIVERKHAFEIFFERI
jgi:FkbM family methyltransferase